MDTHRSHPNAANLPPPDKSELSDREREILQLVATGASNKEIAQRLTISTNTVKVHLRNIFGKISVTSRTEATVYAIREGLVLMHEPAAGGLPLPGAQGLAPVAGPLAPPIGRAWIVLASLILLLGVAALVWQEARASLAAPALASAPAPTSPPRWQPSAALPSPRSGFAIATYENQIYVIGGETPEGVSGLNQRYDPASNAWVTLAAKPTPVEEAGAALIGGRLYVPGGQTAAGQPSDRLESYNPREDRWETRAPLPAALSAYAIAAFEGRLYLFGGWDGVRYVATVYEYDPSRDVWSIRPDMPTARGHASAAVAIGNIYVLGGTDGRRALAVNEEFAPEAQANGEPAWQQRAPLPEGRAAMGAASIADILYLVGGEGSSREWFTLEYFPQKDEWQPFEAPGLISWSHLGLAAVGTNLYALGGTAEDAPTARHLTYQAIYTVVIPVINSDSP